MARDYKNRAGSRKKSTGKAKVAWWKWLLILLLIGSFVAFLMFLRQHAPQNTVSNTEDLKPLIKKPTHQDKPSKEPQYDFYTILPKAEMVVPDHELKTREREERVGKLKNSQYVIQAGSFRAFAEADKLRAQLALMGIESRVEKAKVGNVVWHRVKMGPFKRISSVSTIKRRLRKNSIDAIVTETGG